MAISDFESTHADWREALRKNEIKTRWVISSYLAIFVGVGIVVDISMLTSLYKGMGIEMAFMLLLTFKMLPYATIVMFVIAAISLFITFSFYESIMLLGTDSKLITPETAGNLLEKQLYNVVEEMKVAAGLRYMPKIYLINAGYMNAFATGYNEKSALIAITKGLLEKLDRAELQAVMAHELSHIRHHDIKLNLTIAVLSNILLIVIDLLFYNFIFSNGDRRDNRLILVIMILRYLVPILTILLALFLSRTREYMADAGSVELIRDNEPMARALLKISEDHQMHAEEYSKEYGKTPHEQVRQASYLFDPSAIDPIKSFNNLFSTHPTIQQRLKAIGFKLKSRGTNTQ